MVKRVRANEGEYHQPAYHRPFKPREPWVPPTEAQRSRILEFQRRIKTLLSEPTHPRAWARRILDRQREGEHFPPYVIQCALEVAGDGLATKAPEREPGSD